MTVAPTPDTHPPGSGGTEQVRTYYGRPVVKEPAWTWEVPWYLFAGGLAGAASGLAVTARATGREALADRSGTLAAAGALVSPALLIADLGRPERFLNMLRVFRPTSAMSMGSWLLSIYGPLASGAAALGAVRRLPRVRSAAERAAGVLGMAMTTYTAVLLSDSSIPVWHEARRDLPFVFAGSAAASAGAAALLVTPPQESGPARRLAIAGVAAELVAGEIMQRRLGELGKPYAEGDSGAWQTAAKTLTGLGGGLMAVSGRRRLATKAGAVLVLAGSICQRWAVYRAGFRSAADPRYTVKPQRERLDRGQGIRRDPA